MFLIVLGIFIVFAIICFTIFSYFKDWENYKDFKDSTVGQHDKTVELTFDEVMKYSAIKPDKWNISGNLISYKTGKRTRNGGEDNFYVYFSSYKEYRKFIQWWENKKNRAKQEDELLKGLEFCDLMKKIVRHSRKKAKRQFVRRQLIVPSLLSKQLKMMLNLNIFISVQLMTMVLLNLLNMIVLKLHN